MDSLIDIAGILVAVASFLATLYVAKRGGSFRQQAVILRLSGRRLLNGRTLRVAYAMPERQILSVASLQLEIGNPGTESVEDITLTIAVPEILGSFFDQAGQPNVSWTPLPYGDGKKN